MGSRHISTTLTYSEVRRTPIIHTEWDVLGDRAPTGNTAVTISTIAVVSLPLSAANHAGQGKIPCCLYATLTLDPLSVPSQ